VIAKAHTLHGTGISRLFIELILIAILRNGIVIFVGVVFSRYLYTVYSAILKEIVSRDFYSRFIESYKRHYEHISKIREDITNNNSCRWKNVQIEDFLHMLFRQFPDKLIFLHNVQCIDNLI
jgi:hypothetical protein